ncbi:DUF3592 domain-containing protein [Arthrobacter sp. 35W]|uniref:DUF3592 domain-containing protein n=1 Tax=Arthrobacter sp. 35W TaxID=1132441 RepID=UPI0004241F4D|nr:DUF3592 domain-containing protein [Arthrobacter sp. 35W]
MPKKKPRNWVGIVGCVVMFCFAVAGGTAGAIKGIADETRSAAFENSGNTFHRVPATVTELGHSSKSSSRVLRVRFETVEGSTVTTRVFTEGSNRGYAQGQRVEVVYVAEMPEAARLAQYPGEPYGRSHTIIVAVCAVLVAGFAVYLLVLELRPRSTGRSRTARGRAKKS